MTILDRIVEDVQAQLPARKRQVPAAALHNLVRRAPPCRSLTQALRQESLSVIAEIKRASPSEGIIRAQAAPAVLAARYAAAGARAISVLTEPHHFSGSLEDLAAARACVTVPILRKDFILDEYQLLEARAFGADAVLLIAAVLERAQLRTLQQAAASLGLECLVEVYEPQEMERIDWQLVTMLGVNNRNLRTFQVDITHSIRLLQQVPEPVVRIAESGLKTAAQLVQLHQAGIDAVLIGETLMRAADPGMKLKVLLEDMKGILNVYGT